MGLASANQAPALSFLAPPPQGGGPCRPVSEPGRVPQRNAPGSARRVRACVCACRALDGSQKSITRQPYGDAVGVVGSVPSAGASATGVLAASRDSVAAVRVSVTVFDVSFEGRLSTPLLLTAVTMK